MAEVLPFSIAHLAGPTQPPDAEARRQALDIRSSFIVEAPAGSGKTGLLIQRYLKLLADESVTSPEQVLAITFTNKATAELRDRVLTQLEDARIEAAQSKINELDKEANFNNNFDCQTRALAHAVLERDRQLGWLLLDHPHRLHLRTIDSVCAEIARTLPVLSGSGGQLSPVADANPLHREAARRTLLQLGEGDPAFDDALRNLLLHRDGNLADCESLLANMLSLRDQWGNLIPLTQRELNDAWLDANLLPRLELALDHAICVALTQLERIFPPNLLADLTELANSMAHSEGYKGEVSPIARCKGKDQSPGAAAIHLHHWLDLAHLLIKPSEPVDWRVSVAKNAIKFEIEKHHAAQLKDIIARVRDTTGLFEALCQVRSLPPAKYPADQWAVAKSLFRVLSRALVELQLVFVERSECDFTELSLRAHQALSKASGVDDLAAALGARLQHLLVDEMQDTSTSQYSLIERLTASWDGHSQTVFLVGDPRQSIYLFRQARVERFIHAMHTQQLGDLPLTRLRLTANFRSQRTLVDQFNHDFSLIFPNSSATRAGSAALPYTPADPTLPPSPQPSGAVWHTHLLPASDHALSAAQLRQRQARSDADEILRIARSRLAMPPPPGRTKPWSIAVLVRSRNHLTDLVAALRRQLDPIPFRAVEIEALDERQEILDLTALTRALLHPADRVASLAVLRAPWCGLPLADLHTLTGSDDPTLKNQSIPRLMAERGHLLPDDSCQRMTRVWTILESASAKRASLTTSQIVERAWLSLGGDTWLSPTQLANTRRFFQLLDELETPGIRIDPALLADRLHTLYAEPEVPDKGPYPYLELLTIHKAKGLEWDVVLIPALEKSIATNRPRLLTWSEIDASDSSDSLATDAAHIMLAPIPGRGEESKALNTWLNSIHRSREAAETKRLFYVACTRAREELHIFAAPQLTTKGLLNPASDSLLKAAWAAAEPHFAAAAESGTPGTETPANTIARLGGDLASETWVPNLESDNTIPSVPHSEALALAAAATPSGPILERLPLTFDPATRFADALAHKLPYTELGNDADATPSHTQFSRPEGSFAARSFGNAIHACLDILASRIVHGEPPAALLAELPSWTSRIAAILRADGLPRVTVERLTHEAHRAIENTLRDHDGLWLLASHSRSSSEFAITAWPHTHSQPGDATSQANTRPASIRVDRIFEAGSEPHASGEDYLWIIDYKATAPGPTGLDDFLNAQRAAYGPQLETYARILSPARSKSPEQIRLALYFPTIPRLIWWQPKTDN